MSLKDFSFAQLDAKAGLAVSKTEQVKISEAYGKGKCSSNASCAGSGGKCSITSSCGGGA